VPRLTPGRLIVVVVVLLGVSLAAFNVWFRYSTTNQIHSRWGTEAMLRIAEAPEASWWELVPVAEDAYPVAPANRPELQEINGRNYAVVQRGDLIGARGFVNLRYALGQNGSYSFADDQTPPTQWKWAMVFSAADGKTIVLVDKAAQWLSVLDGPTASVSGGSEVELTEKMSAGIKTFFAERTAAPAKAGAP
jgi:hypothetical protein